MAPPEPMPSKLRKMVELLTGVCGECGALLGDVEAHTKWHAGAEQLDARQVVLEFLQSIDQAELEQAVMAVLEEHDEVSPIVATLDVLKATAART